MIERAASAALLFCYDAIKDYQHILSSDIEEGYQKFNPRMIELKPRRQVGFCS